MRDHGGNIDWAIAHYGGAPENWVDLSTGINRIPYPLPPLPGEIWQKLPTRSEINALITTAQEAYKTSAPLLPVAGAQAAIQLLPQILTKGTARILSPTYNEHAAALRSAGWLVEEVRDFKALQGADLAVVVNPNNPDGWQFPPEQVLDLAATTGALLVDESFADPSPQLSLAPHAGHDGLFVLRSFGKFYGLAGLRLGFVLGPRPQIDRLAELSGPWPISGPAITIGRAALADLGWADRTISRLREDAQKLDKLIERADCQLVGGTELFRLYECGSAAQMQARLARRHIWSRIFPWSDTLIRLGLPGPDREWQQLTTALS